MVALNPSQSKIKLALAHAAFFAVLGYSYYNYVAPMFAYQRFEVGYKDSRLLIGAALLIVMVFAIDNRRPVSLYLNHLTVLIIVTPSLVLFYAGNASVQFISITILCFMTLALVSRLSLTSLPQLASISPRRMLLYTAVLTGGMALMIAVLSGQSTPNFNLLDVYYIREEINEDTGSFFSYLQTLASKSFLTMAVALACVYRQRIVIISLCIIAIIMFGYTTHKSMALYPILVIGVYFATSQRNRMALFVWGVVAVTALAALDTWLFFNNYPSTEAWLLSLLTRRAVMVPVRLNSEYIEIFTVAKTYLWSNSRITLGLIAQPYDIGPASLVASILTGREYSANTGWIGSGYAQAGLMGALAYSVILGLVFSLLDSCAARIDPRIVTAAAIVPIFSALTATDLLTAMVTHGLGVTILMLLMIAPTRQIANGGRGVPLTPHRRMNAVLR